MKVQAKHCNLQDHIFKQTHVLRDISFYAKSLNKSPTHGVLFVSFSYSSKMKFFHTSIVHSTNPVNSWYVSIVLHLWWFYWPFVHTFDFYKFFS